ncbi:cupin domain-containing protein [Nocardiopsis terrae]
MDVEPFVRRITDGSWSVWDDERNGRVSFTSAVGDNTPSDSLTAGFARMPPGGWLGRHSHAATEMYHVLAGQGVVHLDDREEPVASGSVVFIPSHCVHGLHNTGEGDLEFVYVYAADSVADERLRYTYPDDTDAAP